MPTKSVTIEFPDELVALTGFKPDQLSREALKMIILELFREEELSLGKAAELADLSLAEFMEFAASRGVPLHYGEHELDKDRKHFHQNPDESG